MGFRHFGTPLGNSVINIPLTSPLFVANAGGVAGLNVGAIDFIHIQVDSGAEAVPGVPNAYSISWNNLSLTGMPAVPEPASLALAVGGLAAVFGMGRRR